MARFTKSFLPLIVLNQIAEGDRRREPVWGYRISELVEEQSNGRFRLLAGTLYPLLTSLENEGLIEGEWGQDEAGPRRRYFHLTSTGKKVLEEETESYRVLAKLVTPKSGNNLPNPQQRKKIVRTGTHD